MLVSGRETTCHITDTDTIASGSLGSIEGLVGVRKQAVRVRAVYVEQGDAQADYRGSLSEWCRDREVVDGQAQAVVDLASLWRTGVREE